MNSTPSSFTSYALPMLIIVVFGMYYFNGTESITSPTAQQAISNRGFMVFIIYAACILVVTLVSLQTKNVSIFMGMLALLSLIWFILGKSWQYVPS